MNKLKMYVWEDVLRDYTWWMMVALAHSKEEAREMLIKKCNHIRPEDLYKEPKIIDSPEAFLVWWWG